MWQVTCDSDKQCTQSARFNRTYYYTSTIIIIKILLNRLNVNLLSKSETWAWVQKHGPLLIHRVCYKPCSHGCAAGSSHLLQYKLLTLPLGIPAEHNVIRLSAFSESGVLQERTLFTILEQNGEITEQLFGIKDEAGRGIIFTTRYLNQSGLVKLKVQATTLNQHGQITYQSLFIIYISISAYPYWSLHFHSSLLIPQSLLIPADPSNTTHPDWYLHLHPSSLVPPSPLIPTDTSVSTLPFWYLHLHSSTIVFHLLALRV